MNCFQEWQRNGLDLNETIQQVGTKHGLHVFIGTNDIAGTSAANQRHFAVRVDDELEHALELVGVKMYPDSRVLRNHWLQANYTEPFKENVRFLGRDILLEADVSEKVLSANYDLYLDLNQIHGQS